MIRILFFVLLVGSVFSNIGCSKKSDETKDEHHEEEVHLKEESQKMIGLELMTIKKTPLVSLIRVTGEIAQETENVKHVTPPQSGTLKVFKVNVGEVVEAGTSLCLVTTREGTDVEIKSPIHGIVMAQYLKEGDSVDTISSILTIANPDILRAGFNVYEKDLAGIQIGQKVVLESIAYPDKKFEGEILFISPQVDPETRAIKVRVDVKNEEHLLKFGMFVTGKIVVPLSGEGLVIPEAAVQDIKGQPSAFVPQANEPDAFLIRPVKVGRKIEEQIEILEGLSEGETIVTKGSYYLKSELLKGELEEGHAH